MCHAMQPNDGHLIRLRQMKMLYTSICILFLFWNCAYSRSITFCLHIIGCKANEMSTHTHVRCTLHTVHKSTLLISNQLHLKRYKNRRVLFSKTFHKFIWSGTLFAISKNQKRFRTIFTLSFPLSLYSLKLVVMATNTFEKSTKSWTTPFWIKLKQKVKMI